MIVTLTPTLMVVIVALNTENIRINEENKPIEQKNVSQGMLFRF